jgi:hypothetical protein
VQEIAANERELCLSSGSAFEIGRRFFQRPLISHGQNDPSTRVRGDWEERSLGRRALRKSPLHPIYIVLRYVIYVVSRPSLSPNASAAAGLFTNARRPISRFGAGGVHRPASRPQRHVRTRGAVENERD